MWVIYLIPSQAHELDTVISCTLQLRKLSYRKKLNNLSKVAQLGEPESSPSNLDDSRILSWKWGRSDCLLNNLPWGEPWWIFVPCPSLCPFCETPDTHLAVEHNEVEWLETKWKLSMRKTLSRGVGARERGQKWRKRGERWGPGWTNGSSGYK